jgi:hypothetical protein
VKKVGGRPAPESLFELLEEDGLITHAIGSHAIQQSENASKQFTKLPLTELLRYDDTGMLTTAKVPCSSQWDEVLRIISQYSHILRCSIGQLGFISYA